MLHTAQLDCSRIRQLLPNYLNGETDLAMALQMRWHFAHCKNCRMIVHTAIETFRMNFREDRVRIPSRKSPAA